ncbi:MAG: putative LPS assembly protein LptD [Gemmatimonadota bacterium]
MSGWRLALLVIVLASVPAGVTAQGDPADSAAAGPDTIAADTVLTPRDRALLRLRALRPADGGVDLGEAGDSAPAPLGITPVGPGTPVQATPIEFDSIMRGLLALPGFRALAYAGESADLDMDSALVRLLGPEARVDQEGRGLVADSLVEYDLDTEVVCGYGAPTFTGGGDAPVISSRVCYNVPRRLGVALDAQTTFRQTAEWRVFGDEMYPVANSRVFVTDAEFTSCDHEVPHYHFAAREVKVVRDSVLVARDVTLNFMDVPVFWLPFMVQSMRQGRKSGLLTPRFGLQDVARTSSGYQRRLTDVGFYWAISDHLGAALAFDWFSDNYVALRGDFEYRWLRQFLRGNVVYKQFWRTEGGRELTLRSNNSWRPDERTTVSASANFVSSEDFVRRNTFDPRELNRSILSTGSLRRTFDWGSATASATRNQFLDDGRVETTLPDAGITLSNVALFGRPGGFSGSWGGGVSFRNVEVDVDESADLASRSQDRETRTASASSAFRLGGLSIDQRFSLNRQTLSPRDVTIFATDTLSSDSTFVLDGSFEERANWSAGLNYQQRLVGTSTLRPSLSLTQDFLRNDSTAIDRVAGPLRLVFRTDLQSPMYGFFPGVGPIERFRHKFTPSVSYNYSPAPTLSALQETVFGASAAGREQNQIQVRLQQTFEAKYRGDGAETESAEPDPAEALAGPTDGEPRRLPQARKLMLLSVATSAVAYDFVEAREGGDGLTTTSVTNSFTSDLLRGLQFQTAHDLFRPDTTPTGETDRTFDLHLSRVTASFSVDNNFFLFRWLGLGDRPDEARQRERLDEAGVDEGGEVDELEGESTLDDDRTALTTGGFRAPRATGGVGSWRAQLNYSLTRPRDTTAQDELQMLTGSVTFRPTQQWSASWQTGYNFTDKAFADHVVRLTRDLHRWEANFDFVRTQNGNFSFEFRVALRDQRDLELDYEQRSDPRRVQ